MDSQNDKTTGSEDAVDSNIDIKIQTNTEALDRARASMSPKELVAPHSSPGIIILQWLTYAFWGWTLLAFVWLSFIVFTSFMSPVDITGMVPYAIAATLVLLPIAMVCDIFYLRKEPAKKQGAAMIVMVIHAVIFALVGIGILISGVVTIINLAIEVPIDSSTHIAWISTAFASAIVYALAFLRTLNPFSKNIVAKWFWLVMMLVMIGFAIASFIGPVSQVRLVREDEKIEKSIDHIYSQIKDVAEKDGEVPRSLDELQLNDEAKKHVRANIITYSPEEVVVPQTFTFGQGQSAQQQEQWQKLSQNKPKLLRYQLCATYQRQSAYYSANYTAATEDYSSYLTTSPHAAGKVCYKIEVEPMEY